MQSSNYSMGTIYHINAHTGCCSTVTSFAYCTVGNFLRIKIFVVQEAQTIPCVYIIMTYLL